jgi:hypothetical protein
LKAANTSFNASTLPLSFSILNPSWVALGNVAEHSPKRADAKQCRGHVEFMSYEARATRSAPLKNAWEKLHGPR